MIGVLPSHPRLTCSIHDILFREKVMPSKVLCIIALLAAGAAQAQIFTLSRDQIIEYTAKNPFERFSDGRPKVPDALLEKFKAMSVEEVWTILDRVGYKNQYEGHWQILHPEKKLIGRAVTAQFMPFRPDVNEVLETRAKARGGRNSNQYVLDMLGPGDVIVVDLFGKEEGGTFVGDNLATYVAQTTKAGMVIDGSVRDLEGIFPIDMAAYFRGVHPTPIDNVMLTGINVPIRIGGATVLPGDVVFGDREGVYFIPPHLVEQIVKNADEIHIHDEWTQMMMKTGKYKSSEIYPSPKDPALKKQYEDYKKKRMSEAQQ
jgi:4-hydroxy-4-methyl-2-oxoglutarate aldolase